MGHSAHQDLLLHFNHSIASMNSVKILQVSMDGPTAGHKFYSKLVGQRKEISAPGMIDIGSCGLHIIHGAFKTGIEVTGWALKSVLKGAHTVLHDTPARRADYFTVTGSDQYPFFLCNKVGRRHKTSREAFISVAKHAETFLAKKTATKWEEL